MAEVERRGFKREMKDGLNPRLWRQRTRFSLGLSIFLIIILIVSAIRAPTDRIPHPGLILASIEEGRYEDALIALDSLEELYAEETLDDDNTAWIAGQRGRVHMLQGRFAEGVEFLDRAISLDPEEPDFYNWRGQNFFGLGRLTDAETDFSRSIELDSDNFLWTRARGYFYLNTGNYEAALLDAHAAINLSADDPIAYGLRADANRALGRNDVALFDLDTLVDLTPGDWRPYITRARVKSDLGDVNGAVADLDAALALGPSPEGLVEIDSTRVAILGGTAN